jgi:hypothetical protein
MKTSLGVFGGYDYQIYTPVSGSTFFELTVGGSCAAAGTWPVTGSFAGKGSLDGTSLVSQTFTFSLEANTAAGAMLKVGKEIAWITGGITETLSGAKAGQAWGVL